MQRDTKPFFVALLTSQRWFSFYPYLFSPSQKFLKAFICSLSVKAASIKSFRCTFSCYVILTSSWRVSWMSSWSLLCPASGSSRWRGCGYSPLSHLSTLSRPPMIGTRSPGGAEHNIFTSVIIWLHLVPFIVLLYPEDHDGHKCNWEKDFECCCWV